MTLNPAKDPSCVLAFDWGEGSGNIVYDLSNHGNHGFIHGATRTRGILSHAVSLDGLDDYVEGPVNTLNFDEFTIITWVKFTGDALNNNWIINYGHKVATYNGWTIYTGLYEIIRFDVGNGSAYATVRSNIIPEVGKWYFIAGTFDGYTANLIVDGDVVASDTVSGVEYEPTRPLYIGRASWGVVYLLTGIVGSVRIYNRALSEKEIREHYYYGKKIFAQPEMFYHRKISPVLSTKATELARKVA